MDPFAVLGVERRPLLESAHLKTRYFERAAAAHPDASGGDAEAFRTLQDAYRTLDDPVSRLRALFQLCWPDAGPPGSGSPDTDLFLEVGAALQAGRTVGKKISEGGALVRALAKTDLARAMDGLRQASEKVGRARQAWEDQLAGLDARWPHVGPSEVGELAAAGSFLKRWASELAEMEFRLQTG